MAVIPPAELPPFVRFPAPHEWSAYGLRQRTDGHANIQLTVKLYGHLHPGANRHWMNVLPGAALPQTAAKAAEA